ncbi:MAG: hypothetical protein R8P61_35200 [Bacteroidia bacterium]|nr:hypothetical protein [Bacteroidia bacterium]
MKDHNYNIEFVDRYLAGKLEAKEKKEFELAMSADEKLEAYVKELLRVKATTHLAGRESWKKQIRKEFSSPTTNRNRLLIAAIFILLAGIAGILWFQTNSVQTQEELIASQHEFVPAPEMRGEGIDSLLQDAYITYNLKNFPEAIKKFDSILAMDSVPQRDDIYFFKGMALMEEKKISKAISVLKNVKRGEYLNPAKKYIKIISKQSPMLD